MKKEFKQIQSNLFSFRKAFTIVIILNLVFLLERSIFDFMGFMYGMIIADIFYLMFLIIGLFGAYQYRVNYVAASTILSLIWIAWNLFVICVYLNVGFLNRHEPVVLNMNTNMKSWWFTSSIGCTQHIENRLEEFKYKKSLEKIKNTLSGSLKTEDTNQIELTTTTITPFPYGTKKLTKNLILDNFIRTNCFLPFYTIEIIHSGVLIFLSVLCVIFGLLLANAFNEDDDAFDYIGGFDSVHIMPNSENDNMITNNSMTQQQSNAPILPRNTQIRLEPLYATNQNN